MTNQADTFAPALANRLINKYGKTATYTPQQSTFDQVKGELSGTTSSVAVTLTPPSRNQRALMVSDTALRESMVSYLKGSESVEPKKGDKFFLNDTTWNVIRVDPLVSGEQTAAYRLWCTA